MKKIRNIFVLSIGALLVNAQPYMEMEYAHTGVFCSGIHAKNNATPGFLMAGFHSLSSVGAPNFYIDKTSQNGGISSNFAKDYEIYRSATCNPVPPQALNCIGVSVIEAFVSSDPYALAGAVSEGCFYASLDNSGNPVNQMFYPFPAGATAATKPLIIENPTVSQGFVICGSFSITGQGRKMYVLSIDKTGTIQISRIYQCNLAMAPPCQVPHGRELDPKAMMISPYLQPNGAQSLVIVGEASYFSAAGCPFVPPHSSGFFSLINLTTLGWIDNIIYGYQGGPNGPTIQYNRFNAITASNSITQGFTLGGYSDITVTGSSSWLVKINPVGNLISSNIVTTTYDAVSDDITGVIERNSSMYGKTTYATARSATGFLCYKLDDGLNPFQSALPVDDVNEFWYASGTVPPVAEAITFDDATPPGPGWGQGIHIYGDEPGNGNYFVEAAFNGYTDWTSCTNSSTNNQLSISQGPQNVNSTVKSTFQGLNQCQNFHLTPINANVSVNKICHAPALPAAGSNNKVTGISSQAIEQTALSVYPNPVTGIAKLMLTNIEGKDMTLQLYNNLGQLVSALNPTATDANELEIDLRNLDLKNGVYFIKLNVGGKLLQQKIMYHSE